MTMSEFANWLDAYGRAWEAEDVDGFVELFDADVVYHWGPWDEPLRGLDELRSRTQSAISSQSGVRFGHEPLALTPDGRGICRWWVAYQVRGAGRIEEGEGVFLVTLGPDGRCTEFREWWNSRTIQAAT